MTSPEAKPDKTLPDPQTKHQTNINVAELYAQYKGGSPSEVAVKSINLHLGFIKVPQSDSGFFVQSDDPQSCLVATVNRKWADDKPTIHLKNGEEYPAQVALRDPQNDIAILRITGIKDPSKSCPAVSLSKVAPPEGSPTVAIGNTNYRDDQQVVYAGKAIGTWSRNEEFPVTKNRFGNPTLPGINTNNEISIFHMPGDNSEGGAPLFNSKGKVVGIAEGGGFYYRHVTDTETIPAPRQTVTDEFTAAIPIKYLTQDLHKLAAEKPKK
jgi:S1-C subfamily serine protease